MRLETAVDFVREPAQDDDTPKRVYGVVTGQVINPVDPQGLGRVQVRMQFLDSLDLSAWARVATPMAGLLHGTYFIPNIGDEVLIAFEQGDVNVPYIVGSLWNAIQRPPLPTPLAQIRGVRTPLGNQIAFSEATQSVVIQNAPTPPGVMPAPPSPAGPYQTVALSPAGITEISPNMILMAAGGTASITITPAGILLQAGGTSITLTSAGIIIAGAHVNIAATTEAMVLAPMVKINS